MKKTLRRLLSVLCAVLLLLSSASALTLEQAVGLLELYYVDPLPAAAYEAQTIAELTELLDPYTFYMDADEYTAFLRSVEGSDLVGIGVAVSYTQEGIHINSVIPGGAAEELGMQAGDVIIAVDGVSCAPAKESDVSRITGVEGTVVVLTVRHPDGGVQTYSAVRRHFTVPTTTASLLENAAGYLDCTSFSSNTGELFAAAMERYDDQVNLWLVDLRGNSGGRADGAVDASSIFAGPGIYLYFLDREGNYYPNIGFQAAMTDHPAVVLTDRYTASASEIFAAAMRDCATGITVGGRTYGKGVAQTVLDEDVAPELFQGDALKITAYRFYSAAVNTTDCVGVLPTLLVGDEYAAEVAVLLNAAPPEDPEGWLLLPLSGFDFYVDAAGAAQSAAGRDALAQLFAALAPDVRTQVWLDGAWTYEPPAAAAERLGVSYTSRWFRDAASSDYAEELNTLASYQLLQGTGSGRVKPKNVITRAELAAMLCYVLNRTAAPGSSPFTDVPAKSWYSPYVAQVYEMGLMEGRGNGKFAPMAPVTQQELITALGRLAAFLNANCSLLLQAYSSGMLTGSVPSSFSRWSRPYAWLLSGGYVNAVLEESAPMLHASLDDIDPKAPVLREEAAASFCRTLEVLGVLSY